MITEWYEDKDTRYEITGVDVYGKRFKQVYSRWAHARCINIFQGTVWLRQGNGPRRVIYRAP